MKSIEAQRLLAAKFLKLTITIERCRLACPAVGSRTRDQISDLGRADEPWVSVGLTPRMPAVLLTSFFASPEFPDRLVVLCEGG